MRGSRTCVLVCHISFVCVNTEEVGDEEVKYTIDKNGYINELSKTVKNGIGEAVGINYISSKEKAIFIKHLEAVDANDYFERGLELAILNDGLKVLPVNISSHRCIEVDFKEDLERANQSL